MSASPVEAKKPWDDRWTRPEVGQLLEPIEQNRRNLFTRVMEQLDELESLERQRVWLGISWQWTIQYSLVSGARSSAGEEGSEAEFAYLVPNPRQPTVCIPLTGEQFEALPERGLNRYIRDGLKSAKQGVGVHWCKWVATSHAEVDHLADLARRKHRMVTGAGE